MHFSKTKESTSDKRDRTFSSLTSVFSVSSSVIVVRLVNLSKQIYMSYIPPHRRHENVAVSTSSVPPSQLTNLKKNLGGTNTKKIYANDCISRLFLVGSESEDSKFQLVPVSSEWRIDAEETSLVMLEKSDLKKLETPWSWVAEKVHDDLILGFGRAKKTLQRYGSEDVKIRFITRFGKIVFNGVSSSETLRDDLLTKRTLENLKKSFRTNVPKSYVENIGCGVVHNMGLCVEETKDLYHVKVSDNTRPDVTISCKCMVDQQHKRLNFYKAELNALKHLILDVSCLDQDLDMRLTVDSKGILTNLSENEMKNLNKLTDSAVIDPTVKGGLRWPLGKSSCAERYRVCGVWHTVTTTYSNLTMRLQIGEADRYDFRTAIGGSTREVDLKLKALSTKLLKEENVERECVPDMLKDCLKAVWNYFLKAV